MIIQKYRLIPEEFSCSFLLCTPQERAEELTRVFRILIPDLRINYVESTLVAWIGNFHLEDFIENFFRLKTKDLQVYTYLKDNHKEELEATKKLLAKLRLRGLPAPSLYIGYGYYHKKQQEVTSRYVKIERSTIYGYFHRLYEKEYGGLSLRCKEEIREQEKQYLSAVRPVLEALYEAIAVTSYLHLRPMDRKAAV